MRFEFRYRESPRVLARPPLKESNATLVLLADKHARGRPGARKLYACISFRITTGIHIVPRPRSATRSARRGRRLGKEVTFKEIITDVMSHLELRYTQNEILSLPVHGLIL